MSQLINAENVVIPKDHYKSAVRYTPFYDRQRAFDRCNEWYRWSGYSVAHVFDNVTAEYFAIRNSASLFDITPMSKYRIKGPEALEMLNHMVVRDMNKMRVGRVGYTVWCDDYGQVIDDGTIFRLGERDYRLCAQERQMETLLRNAAGFDVTIEEEYDTLAALAFQGPVTCKILHNMGLKDVGTMKPFDIRSFKFKGGELTVSRTGYTGDLGYELWCTPDLAEPLWDAIFEDGADYSVRPIGGRALEIARIEAGFIQVIKDFMPADVTIRPGHTRSPYELDLGWLVKLDKGVPFNGRRALLREKEQGSRYRFVKLDVDGNKTACNSYLYDYKNGNKIGAVTSATWAPSAKKNIAFGYVDMPHGKPGDTIWAEIDYLKELKWNRRWAKCTVVDKPFWDPPRKRVTPVE